MDSPADITLLLRAAWHRKLQLKRSPRPQRETHWERLWQTCNNNDDKFEK